MGSGILFRPSTHGALALLRLVVADYLVNMDSGIYLWARSVRDTSCKNGLGDNALLNELQGRRSESGHRRCCKGSVLCLLCLTVP